MNLECLLFFPIYWHSFKYKLYYKRLVKSTTKPSTENNQTQIIIFTNFCTVKIVVMNLWSFPLDSILSLSNIFLHVYPLQKSIHKRVRNSKTICFLSSYIVCAHYQHRVFPHILVFNHSYNLYLLPVYLFSYIHLFTYKMYCCLDSAYEKDLASFIFWACVASVNFIHIKPLPLSANFSGYIFL